ncbi:MAG: ATP-binding cassette domain-containing protein [Nannocystaceae bacterium]|nr:ATP-binding cassette domain-containing protein [Nannocystaceae bacterium]
MTTPPSDVVLEIKGLVLSGDDPETPGLDLVVHAGESVALLGEQQTRLTQIIRVVGGLESPAAGTVTVEGVDVGTATRQQLLQLRRRVGYVSVSGGLLSNMTVRENIELALRYHCRDTGNVSALLAEGGVTEFADSLASIIPAEYQKCAAYVRALGSEPSVVLLEDPAAYLHPEGRATIERIHARLKSARTTVLMADDDIELASRLATRAIWFSGATITFDGPFTALPTAVATPGRTKVP